MANLAHNINDELDNYNISNIVTCPPQDYSKYIDVSSDTNFSILQLNIRSINKNFDNFLTVLQLTHASFDIIILTECWLSKVTNLRQLDGYHSHFTKNTKNQNDGIAIYIRDGLNVAVNEPTFEDGNCLTCKITNKLAIVAVYRSPSYNKKENYKNFFSSLNNVYQDLKSYQTVALTGDINININDDLRKRKDIENRFEYLMLNASHGLLPSHRVPTRKKNCLDHIMLKTSLQSTVSVLQTAVTDHFPVVLSLENIDLSKNSRHTKTFIDYQAIKTDLVNSNILELQNLYNVNDITNRLILIIQSLIAKHTRVCILPKRRRVIKPWLTPGLLKCIKNRDRLHKKSTNAPENLVLKVTYTRYRNFCNKLLRNLKRSYEQNELQKSRSNPRALWNCIKRIIDKKTRHQPPLELLNISDDPIHSLNIVGDFFNNIGKDLAHSILIINQSAPPKPHSTNPSSNMIFNCPLHSMAVFNVDESDVESIIQQLKNDSATGSDGISPVLIKECKAILIPIITHICNQSIQTGVFPDAFKKAIIHPVHKSGSKSCVDNYRPISVLPTLSKILEKVINQQLNKYLNNNKIISNNQYGFRTQISTEDAVIDLSQHIARTLDAGDKSLGIFVDLSKAFDTVSVPILLSKLERIGIRGKILDLFKSYLANRQSQVKIDKYLSREFIPEFGVPQGSIIGPTLFNIYINDLCNLELPHCRIFTYADDTAIIVSGADWNSAKTHAEAALKQVMDWLNNNLLTINLSKTCFIPFSISSKSAPNSSLSLTACTCNNDHAHSNCSCHTLTRSHHIKYLGVYIDEFLRWEKHINTVASRLLCVTRTFRRLRASADPNILKMVYFALAQSVAGYCIPVWGGAAKTLMIYAERAQRAVLKSMLFKKKRYSTTQLYQDSKVLTVRQLFILQAVIRKHKSVPISAPGRRVNNIPTVSHRTAFSKRQYYVISSHIYSQLNKNLQIRDNIRYEIKHKINNWLLQQDYDMTESLLTFVQ